MERAPFWRSVGEASEVKEKKSGLRLVGHAVWSLRTLALLSFVCWLQRYSRLDMTGYETCWSNCQGFTRFRSLYKYVRMFLFICWISVTLASFILAQLLNHLAQLHISVWHQVRRVLSRVRLNAQEGQRILIAYLCLLNPSLNFSAIFCDLERHSMNAFAIPQNCSILS